MLTWLLTTFRRWRLARHSYSFARALLLEQQRVAWKYGDQDWLDALNSDLDWLDQGRLYR